MSSNPRRSRLLADLPFDALLKIFSECDVDDVLNLSATCKRLNEASGEHQTWLNQATRLQIPIPADVVPSTAELKNWSVSWVRSDERWVKSLDDDDDLPLNIYYFDMRQEEPAQKIEPIRFVMANLIPGGKFVVLLYADGQIDLKEIEIKVEGEWDLRDVAQYKRDDSEEFYAMFWSQLLTETNVGHPLVAYVGREQESLLVFLVDHVAGTVKLKQVVELDGTYFYEMYGIHARGDTILCFYEHGHGWGITVSELGPDPALKLFTLDTNRGPKPRETRFFMVSENAVVICDAEGIHLYHIPELSSAEDFATLRSVWDWPGESEWYYGSVCTTSSQRPVLYLQGASGTHTISFRMGECGRNPTVMKHRITERLPTHLTSPREDNHRFVMKGRKGLCYSVGEGVSYFYTCLLGREELAGGFSVSVELPDDDNWDDHEVRVADFDAGTGRILIGTDRSRGFSREAEGIRIYLTDLPP